SYTKAALVESTERAGFGTIGSMCMCYEDEDDDRATNDGRDYGANRARHAAGGSGRNIAITCPTAGAATLGWPDSEGCTGAPDLVGSMAALHPACWPEHTTYTYHTAACRSDPRYRSLGGRDECESVRLQSTEGCVGYSGRIQRYPQ